MNPIQSSQRAGRTALRSLKLAAAAAILTGAANNIEKPAYSFDLEPRVIAPNYQPLALRPAIELTPEEKLDAAVATIQNNPELAARTIDSIVHEEQRPANVQEFLREELTNAISIEHKYSIPAPATLAKGGLESGWGTSGLARNSNNVFGIKYAASITKGDGKQVLGTEEHVRTTTGTKSVRTKAAFTTYASTADSWDDLARYLHEKRGKDGKPLYAKLLAQRKPEAFLVALAHSPYSTDTKEIEKTIPTMRKYNIEGLVENVVEALAQQRKTYTRGIERMQDVYSLPLSRTRTGEQ